MSDADTYADDDGPIDPALRWTVEILSVERQGPKAHVQVALVMPALAGDPQPAVSHFKVDWPAGAEVADIEAAALERLYRLYRPLILILSRMTIARLETGARPTSEEV